MWAEDMCRTYDNAMKQTSRPAPADISLSAPSEESRDTAGVIPIIGCRETGIGMIIDIETDGEIDAVSYTDRLRAIVPASPEGDFRSGSASKYKVHPFNDKLEYMLLESDAKLQKGNIVCECFATQMRRLAGAVPPNAGLILNAIASAVSLHGEDIREKIKSAQASHKNESNDACAGFIVHTPEGMVYTYNNDDLNRWWSGFITRQYTQNTQTIYSAIGYTPGSDTQFDLYRKVVSGRVIICSKGDPDMYQNSERFSSVDQNCPVGFTDAQKMQNTAGWLMGHHSYCLSGKGISEYYICWSPEICSAGNMDAEFADDEPVQNSNSFEDWVKSCMLGRPGAMPDAVLMSFKCIVPGKAAISSYEKLPMGDLAENIMNWKECRWKSPFREDFGTERVISAATIMTCAFGTMTGKKLTADMSRHGNEFQQIARCVMLGENFPRSLINRLMAKAEKPYIYDRHDRQMLIMTACAAIRKYCMDTRKETIPLNLNEATEELNKDRSFLFGQILAVLDKSERDALQNMGHKSDERTTTAIKSWNEFTAYPARATDKIMKRILTAYYPKLKGWQKTQYDRDCQELIAKIGTDFDNRPLSEKYLIGYSLKMQQYYAKKDEKGETES